MSSNQRCLVAKQPVIKIKDVLEKLYGKYNHRDYIKPDPLQFVYRYTQPCDMEIAGFLAADLAYGRVEQIERSLTDLFDRMGESPCAFVRTFGKAEQKRLNGFKHRFTTAQDISDLLILLKQVLNRYSNIQEFFVKGYNPSDRNVIPALSRFCDSLCDMYAQEHSGRVSHGLKYLLASPARGSACKRLNLFLRWMVRNDEVDAGLWKLVDKAKLIVPIDVHMGRLCRILGLYPVRSNPGKSGRPSSVQTSNGVYDRKTASLATAVKITQGFAEIEPADPVKYDFALTRIGIIKDCNGKYRPGCKDCELLELCRQS